MERMYRNFRASAWLAKPRTRYGAWWKKRSWLYLDELERDENAAAESVVVNHYTIAV